MAFQKVLEGLPARNPSAWYVSDHRARPWRHYGSYFFTKTKAGHTWPALYLGEGNQAARSNCSSSPQVLPCSHATVPHIVALLGFSFHAAKIGIFRLSSILFATYFHFFALKSITFQIILYLCPRTPADCPNGTEKLRASYMSLWLQRKPAGVTFVGKQ